jgi:PAS domain S-box-containing protein
MLRTMSAPTAERERPLLESEARLRAILETAIEGIITIDERGLVESMNPAAEKIFGYGALEVVGRNVSVLMPSPYREHHDGYLSNYLRTGQAKIIGIGREVVGQRKDGSTFPMDLSVGEVKLDGRRLFTGFVRDITERKQLQAAIPAAAEQEKARIARELHDGLGQQIGGTLFLTRGLARDLKEACSPLAERAAQISKLLDDALTQTRGLARGLYPLPAEPDGLMAALEALALRVTSEHGLECRFECDTAVLVHDKAVATHLYRLSQEAVHNALNHSRATRLEIRLELTPDTLRLTVRDNGVGFTGELPRGGLGMQTMKHRAALMGAELLVQNAPQAGVEVVCSVPRPALAGQQPAPVL